MSIATDLIREVAKDTLAEWLDGSYFGSPDGDTDWHLKLTGDDDMVFMETETGRKYKIEMRVTKID